MEHGAHAGAPFGPFAAPASASDDIARANAGPIDLRGAADWRQILRVDTAAYKWGQLLINAEARCATPTTAESEDGITGIETDRYPWAEVRVLVTIAGIVFVWFEGAAGNHGEVTTGGEAKSAGPIALPFLLGEVPDTIEVFARARRGGVAELTISPTELLTVAAATRFKK